MESENESTAEGTKIRPIPKWLNWDTAKELPVPVLRKLVHRYLLLTGKLGSSWQCQLLPKFTVDGFLINNKSENNSGNLYNSDLYNCHLEGHASTEHIDLASLPGTRMLLLGITARKWAGI